MRAFADQPSTVPGPANSVWEELEPHLAGALDALSGADREAVLLRYYRQASHRQIAEQFRISEDTAEKRVNRALDKLRKIFAKQGVTLSAVALTGALTASASATPTGLAGVVSQAVLTGGGGTLAATETALLAKGALHTMFIAKVKTVSLTAAAVVAVTGTGLVVALQAAQSPAPAQSRTDSAATFIATGPVAATGGSPAAVQAAKSTTIATKDGETTLPVLQLSDLVRLTRGPNGLRAEWIGKTSPEQLGRFKTANPPLEWGATIPTFRVSRFTSPPECLAENFDVRCPGEFYIAGINLAEQDGTGIWRVALTEHKGFVWIYADYGTRSPNVRVEYIQATNSVRFIRAVRQEGKSEIDYNSVSAATFADLEAKMGDKLREYLVPVLALLTTQDLFGPAGDPGKVFKAIDTTQSGTYGDGKWSYHYIVVTDGLQKGYRQGFLRYGSADLMDPEPGAYILTPWGWMQWQDRPTRGNWLPVTEKPAKGKQLPDPAVDPSTVSRPPPAP